MRERFLELLGDKEVRLKDRDDGLLPAPLEVYGFGPAEKRFLSRLNQQFTPIWELLETGALLRENTATLLRYLQVEGLLEVRQARPRPAEPDPAAEAELAAEKLQRLKKNGKKRVRRSKSPKLRHEKRPVGSKPCLLTCTRWSFACRGRLSPKQRHCPR